MKNFLIFILVFNFLSAPIFALQLDTSVDDEIRRNYNPSKLEQNVGLPALPQNLNNTQSARINLVQPHQCYTNFSSNGQSYVLLKKGTKFRLKLVNGISDRSSRGIKLTFVSTYPVSTTYFTIPTGTVFYGYILKSHAPQFTGNGGLIAINVNSIILNNELQPISASVTEANSKMIFFNKIKGKRKYISSTFSSMKPGYRFLKKMLSLTGRLAADRSSIILTPFSLSVGILGLGGNILVSPALALFYKGNSVYLKDGSEIEAKLLQDVFVYN